MFATKMLVGAALVGSLAFAAQPAKADVGAGIAVGGCYRPAPVYCPAPVYRPAPVVVARPVYVAPAPVAVYRPYCPPSFSLDFGWFNRHRHHHDYRPSHRR